MLSSLVSMLPCSIALCAELEEGEGGKTALIDQRAVAAGKKASFLPSCRLFWGQVFLPRKQEARKEAFYCCQIRALLASCKVSHQTLSKGANFQQRREGPHYWMRGIRNNIAVLTPRPEMGRGRARAKLPPGIVL